jgi:hypothetical protein
MARMKSLAASLLIALLLASVGCHSGHALVPSGWTIAKAQPLAATQPAVGHLQVFICYGDPGSNHSAVRIETPDRPPLFFDPGGKFGAVGLHRVMRYRCVILDHVPSVPEYWNWRTDFCGERWMEMFEWDLPPDRADRLWQVLKDGSQKKGDFDPDYVGLACTLGVSDFLRQYGEPNVHLQQRFFIPHNLAAYLWTQRPDRVWEFRYPEGISCAKPPAGTTGASASR